MPHCRRARPAPPPRLPGYQPARFSPLYQSVLEWTVTALQRRGYPVPLCKRLALLVTGLVAGEQATLSNLSSTLSGLAITPAKEESVARRLLRILEDTRLDPQTLLPDLFGELLPVLLQGLVAAHAANVGSGASHHRRFLPVRLIVDETSKEDLVHLLVVGLAYQGIVLPLAVRCWPQNTPLPAGEYWRHLGSLLWEVQGLLPPVLRDHVLLLADRFYGIPRMLDLLQALGWSWVLRIQDQTQVCLRDGSICAARTLAPRPGAVWFGGFDPPTDSAESALPSAADETGTSAVFKAAGWRFSQVVAVWAVGAEEPWLLITNLPAQAARLRDYAQRWAIERLFLAWKSHGWDLEASGVRDPVRLGRLIVGLVLATWWRIALAVPVAQGHLDDLAARARARSTPAQQLPLPWDLPDLGAAPAKRRGGAPRPWAAKFSLFTWGTKVAHSTACRSETPALCWAFPNWEAPAWSEACLRAYSGAA